MPLIRDLSPLIAIQAALLAWTLAFAGISPIAGNEGDIRVQTVWMLFLIPGWLTAPLWMSSRRSIVRRYLGACIGSVALHGMMVCAGSLVGFSMGVYLAAWVMIAAAMLAWRYHAIARSTQPMAKINRSEIALILSLGIVSVCLYEAPRSNDIHQFILQQQDMLANDSLEVSAIGMTAMDVSEPMPRWRAQYWHLLPSLWAKSSGLAVDLLLLRYATIPIAFSVLLCLCEILRSLAGRKVSGAIALLAILGPVLFWYRNYTAFNYSFRITNNFLLDKDFSLFFLVPCTVWLATGWIAGRNKYLIPLVGLIPALIRFHPMTTVYLCLLLIPMGAYSLLRSAGPSIRSRVIRLAIVFLSSTLLFVFVIGLGDAQGNHEQIRQIIQTDYQEFLEGRPLHYWVGFYNTVDQDQLPSDTTHWDAGRLHLKTSLLTGCGLLLMTHLCLSLLALRVLILGKRRNDGALLAGGSLTLLMLWGMWFVSGIFLTALPHYAAGYERLHWFAYPVALLLVAATLARIVPQRIRRLAGGLILICVVTFSLLYRFQRQTPLTMIRGINCLLDQELVAAAMRRQTWSAISPHRKLIDLRPDALEESDRVLLLDIQATKHYWCTRQGTFWSDPYVEAFAWFHRDDDFLIDRAMYYAMFDRESENLAGIKPWLQEKRVTLLIDYREGADDFFRELLARHQLPATRVSEGIWRIRWPSTDEP